MTPRSSLVAVALAAAVAGSSATAVTAQEYYSGKVVTMITHSNPGGGYDAYTRLVARHIGKHLPGNPDVIVQNMPGGGGLRALNHVSSTAPQDGTVILLITPGVLMHEVRGEPGLMVSLRKFNWIGNLTKQNGVYITWPTSKVKTIEDAKKIVAHVGATGVGSVNAQIPWAMNNLLGTKFKVIPTYKSAGDFDLAMQRGELDGRNVTSYPSYMAGLPEDVRPKINLLVQVGKEKDPAIPDHVPLLIDLVKKSNPEKLPVARFISLAFSSINRPLCVGPGVPPKIVETVRRAFDATMNDPNFQADADKMGAELAAMTGEEVQEIVEEILSAPPNVVEEVKKVISDPNR
ncbi:MAG TPA: tripartite tricarboxylate transporter substrate-binding protein [Hyphomicrobiaceae bacterium]|nr:tripartite tricarboxylate transporter substrate-binding protein [Hyphomicrobiaceae bacterium]